MRISKKPQSVILLCLLLSSLCSAQLITFGPANPAASSETVNTCFGSADYSVTFSNSSIPLTAPTIEFRLDEGIQYVSSSVSSSSSGSAVVSELDISNLNAPKFQLNSLAAGEVITVSIGRRGSCLAKDLKIAGNTFMDSVFVYESGAEVMYSNGVSEGTAVYDVVYGSLSITHVTNLPSSIVVSGQSQRSVEITNGSFGNIGSFLFADIAPVADIVLSNFVINPAGINYSIPGDNISVVGDSVKILFTAAEIEAVNGSGGTVGDGDFIFEKDEKFILEYTTTPTGCGASNTITSNLVTWWGCDNSICQSATNIATLALENATPVISLENPITNNLDFCHSVEYGVDLVNSAPQTSPAGGNFAKDVTVFLGLRHNQSGITTATKMTMWGPQRYERLVFSNYTLNGIAVTLPTKPGIDGFPVSYIKPDHFTSDPDGPGGLDDIDNDGYFDDLAVGDTVSVKFNVDLTPKSFAPGVGRAEYTKWEHISGDISWYNQCNSLMSPVRQEFVYASIMRDFNINTISRGPTDLSDGQLAEVGIKPFFRTEIDCNGENGETGSNLVWTQRAILPLGLDVDPSYDMSKYTVSGDTIYTNATYSNQFTDFPIVTNCSEWNGVNPVVVELETNYNCSNVSTCYEVDMHHISVPIVLHCGTSCTGVEALGMSSLRTSPSWTNNTQTAIVDLESPGIERGIVYPFDTVMVSASGVFVDTLSDNLFLRMTYSPDLNNDVLEYLSGEIKIVDVDGQYGSTNYSFPLTQSPTVNNMGNGNFELIYNLSGYRLNIDPLYRYGQSGTPGVYDADSITVESLFRIRDNFQPSFTSKISNFRSSFYIMDGGNEVSCSSWGSSMQYGKVDLYLSSWNRFTQGCRSEIIKLYITHRSNTQDDHPYEYRPSTYFDSLKVNIPEGYEVGTVKFLDYTTLTASNYFVRDDSLVVTRPAGYKDYDKQQTFYPRVAVELIPTCGLVSGVQYLKPIVYLKEFAYLTDPTKHVSRVLTSSSPNYIEYTAPQFSIIPVEKNKDIYDDQVSWTVNVCNSTSSASIDYNWILLSSLSGEVVVDSINDLSSGTSVSQAFVERADKQIYVEVGALNVSTCKKYEIFATYSGCNLDSLIVGQGWSCGGFPLANDATACSSSSNVYVTNKGAQISTTVTPLQLTPVDPSNPSTGNWNTDVVTMCDPFPSEIKVVNAQPGNLYQVEVDITIPAGGSGLSYVPGSATIEVEGIDQENTPRAIGAAAEAILIAANNSGSAKWTVTLADLDPTNFGSGEPFFGTDQVHKNEFILRWQNETTCLLASGDNFVAAVSGQEFCGDPAEGSGERIQGPAINVDGVVPTYVTAMNGSFSPNADFKGCNDLKTFTLDLFISGGVTSNSDTVVISLPLGVGYGDGYTCNTPGKCPTFVGASMVGKHEEVRLVYPDGVNGNINFNFDLLTSTRGACTSTDLISFKSENTLAGIACGTGSCPSIKAITGSGNTSSTTDKPDLNITFNNIEYSGAASNPTYTYDVQLSNSSIPTEGNIIVDFYCLNSSGSDITGGIIHKDTLTSILGTGAIANLTGSFSSSCNAANGVAVLITPEYDNCYCGSIESMADKGIGLSRIKHAKQSSVPLPIELLSFSVREKDCQIILSWSTSQEINNEYFVVERSTDGISFEQIRVISGAGNSSEINNYSYRDLGKNTTNHLYYRIKQIDINGTASFTQVEEIQRTSCGGSETSLEVIPNLMPVGQESVHLVFYNNNEYLTGVLQVFDATGRLIFSDNNLSFLSDRNDFMIEVDDLTSGSYQVLLSPDKGKSLATRFVVME